MQRKHIFLIVVIVLFALIWQKLRVVILIPLSPWQAILLFAVLSVVIFLVVDHYLNRSR